MKSVLSIFKLEFYKFFLNKRVLIFSVIGILILLLLSVISFNSIFISRLEWEKKEALLGRENPLNYTQEKRNNILDSLVIKLETAEENLSIAVAGGIESDIKNYENTVAELRYLIETKTIYEDYIKNNLLSTMDYNYYGQAYLFYLYDIFKYLFVFIAILMTSLLITYEYKTGISKNLVSAPVKRYHILLGKLLFIFVIISFLIIFCIMFAFIVGLSYDLSPAYTLIVIDGKCTAVSIYTLFFRLLISIVFAVLAMMGLTLIIGELTDSHIVALIAPIVLYIILYISYQFIINRSYTIGTYAGKYIYYFPILNLLEFNNGFNLYFLFNCIFYSIFIFIILFLSLILNKRKEY